VSFEEFAAMSLLSSLPLLWSQAAAPPAIPSRLLSALLWLFAYGEPSATINGPWGGLLTWVKVIGLFCLLGWVAQWVVAALKERVVRRARWLDVASLVALVGGLVCVLLRVLETTKRIPTFKVAGQPAVSMLALLCTLVIVAWIERLLWSSIMRLGEAGDLAVLGGMHLALGLGIGVSFLLMRASTEVTDWRTALIQGGRLGATYMGFVVLARVAVLLIREMIHVHWRRLYAIAWHSVIEANRRMWAPWVVITVFLVILAFTNWFLHPPRTAEMGRLYVGTLTLLCSLLLTVMVAILTPISLPNDIQSQTIYTIVSKPVRRLELVWGRVLGYMFLVSILLMVFGGISLAYLYRTVNGTILATEAMATKAAQQNRTDRERQLREEADQLRTRMTARVPVKGSLSFIDSRGTPQIKGIDVGQELEYRSHIEGATQAKAIWTFGIVQDPIDVRLARRNPRQPIRLLDRRIPVDSLLRPDSLEGLLNRVAEQKYREVAASRRQKASGVSASEGTRLAAEVTQASEQQKRLLAEYEQMKAQADRLESQARAAADAGRKAEADRLRRQARAMHSPPLPLEMTFTVYRTTKGIIGDPVFASLHAINDHTGEDFRSQIFPIREYYTNKMALPPSILAGSMGDLRIEVQCISPTQYLGMAESDLFLLSHSGTFGTNFMKGLFGIWLQAMVLTAIGVFAGTFLSWPVALLTTIAFFVAGQVAFGFLQEFAMQTLQGGGPFESLIRLLSHDNLQADLAPTLSVVAAKTLDGIVMPVMSRLVYVVPNFSALDVSNTVADGFAVGGGLMASNALLAMAYTVPFSIAGYFILKNREVAA
jgi:hypothetical protein